MRNYHLSFLALSLLLCGCIDLNSPLPMGGLSCPSTPVNVMKVSYNEAGKQYLIFHTAPAGGEKLANPLRVENLQMLQVAAAPNTGDSARLSFQKSDNNCAPVLEMTQGFKIELVSGSQAGTSSGSGGSYWAPFLMGAMAHSVISNTLQPRTPVYYMPPPAGTAQSNGLVTGGVSGKTPEEVNKKYSAANSTKNGFFSRKSSSNHSNSGSSTSRRSGGFFGRKR